MQEESLKDTATTKWIRKQIPISVSISPNLVEQPIFLCNADLHYIVACFRTVLQNLASHCKVQMKTLFFAIETAIKIRNDETLETLNQRQNRRGQVFEAEDVCFQEYGDDSCASTHFLQLQKNRLIVLQKHLKRYCNMLPVFGFNSVK